MARHLRLISLAAVAAVAACSTKEAPPADTAAAAPAAATSTAPNVITLTASEYKFEAPDQIPAGLTTFKMNDSGEEIHHASLIKLDSGHTVAELVEGIKNMKPGTHPPGWVIPAGGPNAVAPGTTSTLTMVMQPGNYAIVCFVPDAKGVPHVAHGMIKALTVTENPAANMAEPASDITVTMKDYQWEFSTPLTAGKHTLKLVTAPGQPHEFTLFSLAPGKKAADLIKFFEGGMKGQPPGAPIGGVAGVAAGMPSFYEIDAKAGNYALVCFLEDAKDGKPHFAHGMIQDITVN